MSRGISIGIDRRIQLEWIEATAALVAAGHGPQKVRQATMGLLDGIVAGKGKGSARSKTATVLTRVWSRIPPATKPLRDRALPLLVELEPRQRLALHWAMLLVAYPFFTELATQIGRLTTLQGDISLAQLTRRMAERWGDRSTMVRAVQRLVRSLVQWEVLRDTRRKGTYERRPGQAAVSGQSAAVLLEALLRSRDGTGLPLAEALAHPAFFPFQILTDRTELQRAGGLEIHRQGLDEDIIVLARVQQKER